MKFGLVARLSQPGGNATGVNFFTTAVEQKRFDLFHELGLKAEVIGLLVNPANPNAEFDTKETQAAAEVLGYKLIVLEASTVTDINAAFTRLVQARARGLITSPDTFFTSRRVQIVTLAARHALPTIYPSRDYVVAGGLASYASDIPEAYRQMAIYTAQILGGAKPADLPVIQPTKLEFVINLSTATALGLAIPAGIYAIADEVIE